MAKSSVIGPIEEAAIQCYRWYAQADTDEAGLLAIRELMGSPLDLQQMKRISARMRQSEDFHRVQTDIFSRWQHRFDEPGALGEEDAQIFLQELFNSFDRNLLFDRGVIANITTIERGKFSDSQTHHKGTKACWTLHLTTHGKALYLNDNMELEAKPGDLILFRPEAHFHCGLHPGARRWEHLWALFQPLPHWGEILEWHALDRGIFHVPLPDAESRNTLERVFREVLALGEEHSPIQLDLQYNKLEELLIRARGQSAIPGTAIDLRIQKACEFMRSNLTTGFHLHDVATACNLSTSRLAHLFTKQMGISPKSWSSNMRLQQARKLLLGNDESINHIARQLGYDDPAQFSRYFKKNIGCSPREFRQSFSRP